jgi:Zn-dependent protease with chaperone function
MRGTGRTSAGDRAGHRGQAPRAYDRAVLIPGWFLALVLVVGLLVLLPARRLQLAGLSGRTIGIYVVILWLAGLVMAVRPVGARFLIPIVLLAYIAPFVAAPEVVGRVLRRGRPRDPPADPPRPPMKNVTPPDDPVVPG